MAASLAFLASSALKPYSAMLVSSGRSPLTEKVGVLDGRIPVDLARHRLHRRGVFDRRLLEGGQGLLAVSDRLAPAGADVGAVLADDAGVLGRRAPECRCLPAAAYPRLPEPRRRRRLRGRPGRKPAPAPRPILRSSPLREPAAAASSVVVVAAGAGSGLARALCAWKKAKSSGLDGSAMMRTLDDSIVSDSTCSESGTAGCFISSGTSKSLSLVFRSADEPRRMMSGSPARSMMALATNGLPWFRRLRVRRIAGDFGFVRPHAFEREIRCRGDRQHEARACRTEDPSAQQPLRFSRASLSFRRKLASISCIAQNTRRRLPQETSLQSVMSSLVCVLRGRHARIIQAPALSGTASIAPSAACRPP